MNRTISHWASVMMLILLAVSFAVADNKPVNVRFLAGPQGFTQPKIKLQIEGSRLILTGKAGKKRKSFTIPLESVTFMVHSPVRFNRASQVSRTVPNADVPRMGSCSGLGCAGNVLVLFAWGAYETGRGAAIGVAATQHGKEHFITIDWRDEGVEYELQLEAGKDDYSPLIRDLENATGKKFFDFEDRWKQAQADIQREASHAELVSLKKVVRLGELSLSPGVYSVVAIPREGSLGVVYLFDGKRVDSTTLRGLGPVRIAEAKVGPAVKECEVDYTESTPTQIKEIRTATKTLMFISSTTPVANPEKDLSQPPPQLQK